MKTKKKKAYASKAQKLKVGETVCKTVNKKKKCGEAVFILRNSKQSKTKMLEQEIKTGYDHFRIQQGKNADVVAIDRSKKLSATQIKSRRTQLNNIRGICRPPKSVKIGAGRGKSITLRTKHEEYTRKDTAERQVKSLRESGYYARTKKDECSGKYIVFKKPKTNRA